MSEDNLRLRVVFDCMIYLQATVSESGPAAALLRLVDDDAFTLFVSNDILAEVRDVLSRPNIRQKNSALTDARVDAFLSRVAEKATLVGDVQQHFTYIRDPKDEKYINLALEVAAAYLVSRDKDLLDLMTSEDEECQDFRRRFPSLQIIAPVEFLKKIRASTAKE
jgi:uncharacterized protein